LGNWLLNMLVPSFDDQYSALFWVMGFLGPFLASRHWKYKYFEGTLSVSFENSRKDIYHLFIPIWAKLIIFMYKNKFQGMLFFFLKKEKLFLHPCLLYFLQSFIIFLYARYEIQTLTTKKEVLLSFAVWSLYRLVYWSLLKPSHFNIFPF